MAKTQKRTGAVIEPRDPLFAQLARLTSRELLELLAPTMPRPLSPRRRRVKKYRDLARPSEMTQLHLDYDPRSKGLAVRHDREFLAWAASGTETRPGSPSASSNTSGWQEFSRIDPYSDEGSWTEEEN